MTHSIWDFSVLVEKDLQRCWEHLNFQTRCSSRTAAQLVHSLLAARVQIKPSLTRVNLSVISDVHRVTNVLPCPALDYSLTEEPTPFS